MVSEWGSFVLKEKLKLLIYDIKIWSREKFGKIDEAIAKAALQFNDMDKTQEVRNLSEGECSLLKEAKEKAWQLKKVKDSYSFQKS